jgi:prepilin signal peptidase PulO-like enzyme (type II secretory pathway)
MTIFLLSVLPVISLLAVFVYAVVAGTRVYRKNGQVSILGVAVLIAGLAAGRLIDRFVPLPTGLDDWVNLRDAASEAGTRSERFLAVLSVEVALLFLFAAVIGFVAITLIRRDGVRQFNPIARPPEVPLLSSLFVFAVGITLRSKLAVLLAFLMAKGNLL